MSLALYVGAMNKKLIPMEGGKAIVIDLPLLAIIGADDAAELDLTTDGERLILSKVRGAARSRSSSTRSDFDRDDPKAALRLIREMQKLGFTQDHFRQLHHFGPRASLAAHIKYCDGTGRFTAETNRIVSDRLNYCLEHVVAGTPWDEAIKAARDAFPFE